MPKSSSGKTISLKKRESKHLYQWFWDFDKENQWRRCTWFVSQKRIKTLKSNKKEELLARIWLPIKAEAPHRSRSGHRELEKMNRHRDRGRHRERRRRRVGKSGQFPIQSFKKWNIYCTACGISIMQVFSHFIQQERVATNPSSRRLLKRASP